MGIYESLAVGIIAAVALYVPVYYVLQSDDTLTATRDVRLLAASLSLPLAALVAFFWPVGRIGLQDADAALETMVIGVYLVQTLVFWGLVAYVRSPYSDE